MVSGLYALSLMQDMPPSTIETHVGTLVWWMLLDATPGAFIIASTALEVIGKLGPANKLASLKLKDKNRPKRGAPAHVAASDETREGCYLAKLLGERKSKFFAIYTPRTRRLASAQDQTISAPHHGDGAE